MGFGDPGKTLKSLLEQASAEQPGLAAAVGDLLKRVKDLGAVDLEKDLLPSLGGEGAFALQPAPREPAEAEAAMARSRPAPQAPILEFLAGDVDAERAGKALARLEGPIAAGAQPLRAGSRLPRSASTRSVT